MMMRRQDKNAATKIWWGDKIIMRQQKIKTIKKNDVATK